MNAKLLIPVGILAFFLMGGKKSKKTSSSQPVDDVPIDDIDDVDVDPTDNVPKKDPVKKITLSKPRIDLADEFIKNIPTYVVLRPDPYGDYFKWSQSQPNKSYYDWLTNQIYWQISFNEKKTDLFDLVPTASQNLPFLLHEGERGYYDLNNQTYQVMKINESKAQANSRLSSGIPLWLAVRDYIRKNLKACPEGVVCK